MERPTCEGCLQELDALSRAGIYNVCMSCTVARHKAVLRKRCVCRKKQRRERQCKAYSRIWIACDRCLGQVRQVA